MAINHWLSSGVIRVGIRAETWMRSALSGAIDEYKVLEEIPLDGSFVCCNEKEER